MRLWVAELNRVYRDEPAMHELDSNPEGFAWLVGDDSEHSVFAWARCASGHRPVVVLAGTTPGVHHNYRIKGPRAGRWNEVANSDEVRFGGSGVSSTGAEGVETVPVDSHGQFQSVLVTVPPLAVVILAPKRPEPWVERGRRPFAGFTAEGEYDATCRERPGATAIDGGVRFEVWAPRAESVSVVLDPDGRRNIHAMQCPAPGDPASTWSVFVEGVGHGDRYRYRLQLEGGGEEELADPASRHQPDGVSGPSAVVDTGRFAAPPASWGGVELADAVIYELHVGTFTSEGTLDSAAGELPRLASLGVTLVELMPLAQFSGTRGWGYDGVFTSAVQHSYGGPEALARFVAAAHRQGIGVIVDVVYNHFGPEGNVNGRFGDYVTDSYHTPWGGAVNFAGAGSDQVRRLFLDNVRLWVDDFGVDGLRLDAVHAIVDPTARPFLEELDATAHGIGRRAGRSVLVFLESSDNDPATVLDPPAGIGGDAVWNDEYHHALRVALTGDRSGYYEDFTGAADVAEVLGHRWTYRGRYSRVRGRRHGREPLRADGSQLGADRFVVFDQNHDQVGNRRDGERLDVLVDPERRKVALAAVLLSPFTPLLFMGEEYGETAPFPYFVDHSDPALLEAVRRGRAREFAGFAWSGEPPDPGSFDTFSSAVLDPGLASEEPHRSLLALTTELLALRRSSPVVRDPGAETSVEREGETVVLRRRAHGNSMSLVLRFADDPGRVDLLGDTPVLLTSESRWGGPSPDLVEGAAAADASFVVPGWAALFALGR
ncbi:MAG: malto-oligosyltrehalose trehalohydrolase [Microthrixaceae bacterium]